MDWKKFIKTDFFCIAIILLIACVNILIRPYSGNLAMGDTSTYIEATEILGGEKMEVNGTSKARELKPAPLLGILTIAEVTNFDFYQALITESFFFYLVLAVTIYYFLKLFFKDNMFLALGGTILFICGYPLMKNGISMLTETGAHFFYVLAVLFIYLFYKNPSTKNYILSFLLIIIGLYWKEYSAIAGLLFFITILLHPKLSVKEKISKAVLYVALSILIFIPWQIYTYKIFNYSYINWFMMGVVVPFKFTRIYYTLKSLFGVFLIGWILVVLGIKKWNNFNPDQKFILKYLSLSALLMFVWSGTDSRLFYVLALPGVMFAVAGIRYLLQLKYNKIFVFIYLFSLSANYYWLFASENFRSILNRF